MPQTSYKISEARKNFAEVLERARTQVNVDSLDRLALALVDGYRPSQHQRDLQVFAHNSSFDLVGVGIELVVELLPGHRAYIDDRTRLVKAYLDAPVEHIHHDANSTVDPARTVFGEHHLCTNAQF